MTARASTLQVRVREAIAALGGYWTPANAAIRLLEELGELAEHTLDPLLGNAALASECADLWIITTALADQFHAFVDEPRPLPATPVDGPQQLAELVAAGGRIGRVVNHYDGPKNPRSLDGWLTLEQAVAAFHGHLLAFTTTHGIDLLAAVDEKLGQNVAQDAGRFATSHDARTAPVLARFSPVLTGAAYPFPGEDRLFGAPDWLEGEWLANLAAIRPPLATFLHAAPHERLDGFVVPGPPHSSAGGLSRWRDKLIAALAIDERAIETHLFSPLRPADDPGHAPDEAFVLFRPRR